VKTLKKDGRWSDLRSRLTTFKRSMNFVWNVGKLLVISARPGYHPASVSDPDWVKQWMHAYDGLSQDQIPLLDTSDPNIPAQFT